MANAALAGQIETRVNAWRHRTPMKGDAVKAIDGWIRDAGTAGESDAAAMLRRAVAVAERVGTVKSVAPWDAVIAELDAAVKSLRGATKADDSNAFRQLNALWQEYFPQFEGIQRSMRETSMAQQRNPKHRSQWEASSETAAYLEEAARKSSVLSALFVSPRPRSFMRRSSGRLHKAAALIRSKDWSGASTALYGALTDWKNARMSPSNDT